MLSCVFFTFYPEVHLQISGDGENKEEEKGGEGKYNISMIPVSMSEKKPKEKF